MSDNQYSILANKVFKNIDRLVSEHHKSELEFLEAIGMKRPTWSGKKVSKILTLEEIHRIATHFKVPISSILGENDVSKMESDCKVFIETISHFAAENAELKAQLKKS